MIIIEQLKIDEGFRKHVYKDTLGYDTVGYGYCLTKNPCRLSNENIKEIHAIGITEKVAEQLLIDYCHALENKLHSVLPCFETLNDVRKEVLINMSYNLGVSGVLGFKHMIAELEKGDFERAAICMIDSKWATQVKARATRLAEQMKNGK